MCHITFHIVAFKNIKTSVLDGLLNPELIHIIMCHITFHIVAFKNKDPGPRWAFEPGINTYNNVSYHVPHCGI